MENLPPTFASARRSLSRLFRRHRTSTISAPRPHCAPSSPSVERSSRRADRSMVNYFGIGRRRLRHRRRQTVVAIQSRLPLPQRCRCLGRSRLSAPVAAYDDYGGWFDVCGTSVAAPLIAGMFAIAGHVSQQDAAKRSGNKKSSQRSLHRLLESYITCLFSTYTYSGGWGSPDGTAALERSKRTYKIARRATIGAGGRRKRPKGL